MRKPKIAFLIPRLGITDRGAEIFVYELASYLSTRFDITLWARNSPNNSNLLLELERKGVKIKKVYCFKEEGFWANVLYRFRLLRPFLEKYHLSPSEIEMLSFSLVCLPGLLSGKMNILFPNNGFWGALVCRLIRAIKKTPFVYTFHGGIEPLVAKQKPDCYFALNESIEKWLKEHFPKLKVIFLPNGVNLQRFTPRGKKVRLGLEPPIFLTVAALIPVKRIEITIGAVSKLRFGSLLVLGDGPLRAKIKKLGFKLLGKKRFMLKAVKSDQIAKFYRSVDVFTLAAQGESGSLVHLEAMACGIPVVVNNEEHLRFVVGDGGLCIDTADRVAYSKALGKAAEMGFGDKPRKQAEKFSWENTGERYKNEFMKLLN